MNIFYKLNMTNRKAPYNLTKEMINAIYGMTLQEGIDLTGEGRVYVDTDSVKYVGNVDLSEFNARRIEDKSGKYAFYGRI